MTRQERAIGIAGSAAVIAAVVAVSLWWYRAPVTIAAASGDARVRAVSRGEVYWTDDKCRLWRHPVGEPPGPAAADYVMQLSACSVNNPIFTAADMFRLTGGARVVRHAADGSIDVVAEKSMSRAFAVDDQQVYLGRCALSVSCQIVLASGGSEDAVLMQGTRIFDLGQLSVDGERLFWLDHGEVVRHHGTPPPPPEVVQVPRLMTAPKVPHADESVLVDDFAGERFFLTPGFVLWQSAGKIWRIDKKGGAARDLMKASALHAAAIDGVEVFLATDDGIWEMTDGESPRRRYTRATKGLAVDAKFIYFAPTGDDAVVRIAR